MNLRQIAPGYAVSPQIEAEDIPALAEAGITTIICNRPDAEVPPSHQAEAMRAAAEAAGLRFVANPFSHQAFSMSLVDAQAKAIAEGGDNVFAYCASGNRSTVLWGMAQAKAGTMTPTEIIDAARQGGYDLSGLQPQLMALSGN